MHAPLKWLIWVKTSDNWPLTTFYKCQEALSCTPNWFSAKAIHEVDELGLFNLFPLTLFVLP